MSLSSHQTPPNDRNDAKMRALERACDAALFGDIPSGDDLLDARAVGVDLQTEAEAFERVAAQVLLEAFPRDGETDVPAALRTRLHALADALHQPAPIPIARAAESRPARVDLAASKPDASRPGMRALRDWLVAAACIAFGAAATWLFLAPSSRTDSAFVPDPAVFVSQHPTSVRWPWTATEDKTVVGQVRGEAIFDPECSCGLLVISGLAPNDPSREQYQLWIFDETRDDRYPVDGGVFDMPECGSVVLPVQAKLDVRKPTLLAVTVEKPGGTVVSDRRIAILAKP